MELTVYIYSKFNILTRCVEVFISTHFRNRFSKISFKSLNRRENESNISNFEDISGVLKHSLQSLRTMHESLKLKEKNQVWLVYLDSFDFDNTKNGTILLLNNNLLDNRAICHLFKGKLDCINNKVYDLEKTKVLNENLKKLFRKDSSFIRY